MQGENRKRFTPQFVSPMSRSSLCVYLRELCTLKFMNFIFFPKRGNYEFITYCYLTADNIVPKSVTGQIMTVDCRLWRVDAFLTALSNKGQI